MKKILLVALLAFAALGALVAPVTVEALTDGQQNALTMLLRSFGADDSAIKDFQGAVLGATTGPTDDYGSDGTSTVGVYCPKLTATMQRGARDAATGGQVTELQLFLADYFNLNEEDVATGFFGRLTQSYVVKFQQEKGLPAFGIAGSLTRAKIAEWCGKGQTGSNPSTVPVTGGTVPSATSPLPGTGGTTGSTVVTSGTDTNGLNYTLTLKGGGGTAEPSFVEGTEIGPFVLTVKNVSSATQSVTFPNNCWYSYRISDRGNGGRIIFDLSSIQQCVSAESSVSKTFTLKPGDSFYLDITHKFQTAHIPSGDYSMGILLNTRSGSDTVAKLNFKVWSREPTTSGKLSCAITSDKSSYVLGETITVKWATSGANYANWIKDTDKDNFFLGGDKLAISGVTTFVANVTGNPYLVMRAYDVSGNMATCRLVIPVTSNSNQTSPPPTTSDRGILQMTFDGVLISTIPNVTKVAAQAICVHVQPYDNPSRGTCTWNGQTINGVSQYGKEGDPRLTFIRPTITANETITIGTSYTIQLTDSSAGIYDNPQGKYWVYANKFSTAGVFEKKIALTLTGAERSGSTVNLYWNFGTNAGQIQPGWYYISAVNTENGVWGGVSNYTFLIAPGTTPTPLVAVSMSANPSAINPGQSTTLTWSSTNGYRCTLEDGGSSESVASSGAKTVAPSRTTTYTVRCANDRVQSSNSLYSSAGATVTVDQIGSVSVNPGTFSTMRPTLTGTASGLTSFTLQLTGLGDKYADVVFVNGGAWSHTVSTDLPNGSYTATAYDPKGNVLGSGTFTVSVPVATGGELYAVGVYEAQGALHNFCYSKPGVANVNLVQLVGAKKGTPVTLSLSAYEPVHWKVNVPSGVNLQRVILSGYNNQAVTVTGASPLVTHHYYLDHSNVSPGSSGQGAFIDDREVNDSSTRTTYHWAGQATCANTSGAVPVASRWYFNSPVSDYFYAYQQGDSSYSNLVSRIQSISGLTLKNFQGAYSGSSFTVTVGTPQY